MNEKLKELKAELAKLTDAIAEIEKHCKEEHGFKEGQYYWYITTDGIIYRAQWWDDSGAIGRLSIGNAFHTQQEAEQRQQYLKAEATLRRFMKGKPEGNRSPYYNAQDSSFYVDTARNTIFYIPKFLYSDVQTIEQLISTHERELKIYFEVAND